MRISSQSVWIRAALVLAALVVTAQPKSASAASLNASRGSVSAAQLNASPGKVDWQPPPPRSLPSPNGRYVATNGKAKDGYHDTIWLRDTKTGVTIGLLAPEKSPGAGGNGIVAWLDNEWLAFVYGCGTGCVSLQLVNVETRSIRYFCTDGPFFLSPDREHAVGQSDNPYGLGDKRGGLAVIAIDPADSYPTRQDDCEATIPGCGECMSGQVQESRSVSFGKWSADSKSFTYTVTPCIGGKWRAQEKRVYHLK